MKTILSSLILTVASIGIATAGECPADKVRPAQDPNGPTAPTKVTDTVVEEIDLLEQAGVEGRILRIRRIVIERGGEVPQHSHAMRAAHLYIAEGTMTEHRNTCSVPIVHKKGDIIPEPATLTHWWSNESRRKAVIIATDVVMAANPPAEGEM